MTSRIAKRFATLKEKNRTALVTYLTAGDPGLDETLTYMQSLTSAGADIIELGMPFSDPMADGPVIQRASERALLAGMSLKKVLELVRQFRTVDEMTPIVLMGYLNPVEAMGYDKFSQGAADAGVDGVLIVDSPPEESAELNAALRHHSLEQIFLISPNSDDERVAGVSALGGGFVYYVTVKGVTGDATLDVQQVAQRIDGFRDKVTLPIGIGFGIKTPEHAAAVAAIGDAVIIGSALVEVVEKNGANVEAAAQELRTKVAAFRQAMG